MRWALFVFALMLVAVEAVSQLRLDRSDIVFESLFGRSGVRSVDLDGVRSADRLGFDRGISYLSERGGKVDIMILSWNQGNARGLMDAFGHSPEVCLPVSGAKLLSRLPSKSLVIDGRRFEVERWMFKHPLYQERLHAYKIAHSSHPELVEMAFQGQFTKARLLLLGQRELMPAIEIAIGVSEGPNDPELAWERFSSFAENSLRLEEYIN